LPKDSWLKRFSYRGNSLLIEGFTSSTTNLLRKLQDSGLFSSIKVRGTPRKQNNREVFSIELTLK
jgi:Tfp pilus assembly protein PilN